MKKFMSIAAIAAAMCAVSFGATNEELQAKINNAKANWQKATYTVELELQKKGEVKSFDEIVKVCEDAYSKYGIELKHAYERAASLGTWEYKRTFVKEAFELSKKHGNSQQFYIVLNDFIETTPEEGVEILSKFIKNGQVDNDISAIKNAVEKIIEKCNDFDNESEAKKALSKLNRALSPRLLKDKATWEPIVAMIRTALDTY